MPPLAPLGRSCCHRSRSTLSPINLPTAVPAVRVRVSPAGRSVAIHQQLPHSGPRGLPPSAPRPTTPADTQGCPQWLLAVLPCGPLAPPGRWPCTESCQAQRPATHQPDGNPARRRPCWPRGGCAYQPSLRFALPAAPKRASASRPPPPTSQRPTEPRLPPALCCPLPSVLVHVGVDHRRVVVHRQHRRRRDRPLRPSSMTPVSPSALGLPAAAARAAVAVAAAVATVAATVLHCDLPLVHTPPH